MRNNHNSIYYIARIRAAKKMGKGRLESREFCAEELHISKNKLAEIEHGKFPDPETVASMVELFEDRSLSIQHCQQCPVRKMRRALNGKES